MKKSPETSAERFVNVTFPRIALCLAVLSTVFWYTSWPTFLPVENFPNCISTRWDDDALAVGFVSHDRVSCMFITTHYTDWDMWTWSERSDSHFCGFPVPASPETSPPRMLGLSLGFGEIAWICPYWLMVALWSVIAWKGRSGLRFGIADSLAVTTCLAAYFGALKLKAALLLAAPLNLLTAAMFAILISRVFWTLVKDSNPLWPFIVNKNTVAEA
jgi:hypothetical protein